MARMFRRRLGVLDYGAGRVSRLELPRNHMFRDLLVQLEGTLTIAGGTTDGTLHDEEPQSLIRDIRIVRNGSEILQMLDGGTFYQLASINWGTPPPRTAIGSAGVAVYDFACDIPIIFNSPGLINPSMSLLRAFGTSSLFLELTWGSEANLVTGGDRTETLSNVTATVFGMEIMDVSGRYADKMHHAIESQITATTSDHQIDLETGPRYRRLILKATDNDGFDLSNAIVNEIQLNLDGVLYLMDRYTWGALRSINKMQYGLEVLQDGYAVIDFAEDGSPKGFIATELLSSAQLSLDVTIGAGITRVQVIPEIVTPAKIAVEGTT